MGVRYIVGAEDCDAAGRVAMFCSTTGLAFGPLFDSTDDADAFQAWACEQSGEKDVRNIGPGTLDDLTDQWKHLRARRQHAMSPLRLGPTVTHDASCYGCANLRMAEYVAMGERCSSSSCAHFNPPRDMPEGGVPAWCPYVNDTRDGA